MGASRRPSRPGPVSPTWGRDVIRIEALPAQDGDCLWLEWPDSDGVLHRMLVDGGRGSPTRCRRRSRSAWRGNHWISVFDLVVCTHIDADHIGGLPALVDDPPQGFATADVWFNGRDHLDILGPVQGDHLSDGLRNSSSPWNRRFDGHAVVIPGRGGLTVVELPGLRITLLSPTRAQLAALAAEWPRIVGEVNSDLSIERQAADTLRGEKDDRTIALHRLARRPFEPDDSAANASSNFVAEHDDGGRVLLAGDATAEVLVAGCAGWPAAAGTELISAKCRTMGAAQYELRTGRAPRLPQLAHLHQRRPLRPSQP